MAGEQEVTQHSDKELEPETPHLKSEKYLKAPLYGILDSLHCHQNGQPRSQSTALLDERSLLLP
jgi:hypothetical protein